MFHDYYDIIHAGYDYDIDIETLDAYCTTQKINRLNLLEVGCGTGRHTALLADHFERVFAIDLDPEMIKRARQNISDRKINNVLLFNMTASELQTTPLYPCDIACSLFNVINYIIDFEALVDFFRGIFSSLKPNGACIFDCLDARKKYEKQASFSFAYEIGEKKALRTIESAYDLSSQILHVREEYSGFGDKGRESHEQAYKLWSSEQIELALKKAGFEAIFHDKKTCINPKYRKQNQTLYFAKRDL